MIYTTKEAAMLAAANLNKECGHPKAYAVLTKDGWTVIRSYANPHAMVIALEVA
jgi:hypothetical protein